MIYKNAIRILVPRDLHIGNEEFEALQPQDTIEVEIRKSRFQMNDSYILSVAVFVGRFNVNMAAINAPDTNVPTVPEMLEDADEEEGVEERVEGDSRAQPTINTLLDPII